MDLITWWGGEGDPPEPGCRRLHALRSASPYAPGAGDTDGLGAWIADAERAALELGSDTRPRLVLAVGLPLASLVAGVGIARVLGVPFVADLGDPWEATGAEARAHRTETLGEASALITTTDALAAELSAELAPGTPVLIAPAGGTVSRRGPAVPRADAPLFVQLGTLTRARVDPRPAYRALGALHAAGRIEFRSRGGAWLDGSETLPHPHGPPLGHDDALELLGRAGAALVLGNTNREQLPSKAFELACTDVWALCVSGLDNDPTAAVLRGSGHAVEAANDEASIRAAALEIVSRTERGERPEPEPAHSWARRLDGIAELLRAVSARGRSSR